jgi:SpoVK/Ycf46/Vps4 family AAA+-type ATPase
MEDHRDELVVILAGYEREMAEFLSANSGLRSRLANPWHFEDYTTDQLTDIGVSHAESEGYRLGDAGRAALRGVLQSTPRGPGFGNGRVARQLVDDAIMRQAVRLANRRTQDDNSDLTNDELTLLLPDDIDARRTEEVGAADPLMELDNLVGLAKTKETVRRVVHMVEVDRARVQAGLPSVVSSRHMVFAGNPGTGKTTVARLVGQALKKAGALRTGTVVEASRPDLVGRFIGHTAPKTQQLVESALGGVLFIDEAYSLTNRHADNDFGPEALEVLLKLMEDYRDDIVVIVAGYNEPMQQFLDANEGLRSRFPHWIDFPDYTTGELRSIWDGLVAGAKMACTPEADGAVTGALDQLRSDPGFANGRSVRSLFESAVARQATRVAVSGDMSVEALSTLTADDVVQAVRDMTASSRPRPA